MFVKHLKAFVVSKTSYHWIHSLTLRKLVISLPLTRTQNCCRFSCEERHPSGFNPSNLDYIHTHKIVVDFPVNENDTLPGLIRAISSTHTHAQNRGRFSCEEEWYPSGFNPKNLEWYCNSCHVLNDFRLIGEMITYYNCLFSYYCIMLLYMLNINFRLKSDIVLENFLLIPGEGKKWLGQIALATDVVAILLNVMSGSFIILYLDTRKS